MAPSGWPTGRGAAARAASGASERPGRQPRPEGEARSRGARRGGADDSRRPAFSRPPERTCAWPASPRRRRHASSIGRAASPSGASTFLYGISFSSCAMVFSRARFLSSDRTMYQGAMLVSVALSMASRAREYSYHLVARRQIHGLSFHCRSGSSMRASNRRSCSLLPTSSQNLMRMMPASMMYFSITGQSSRNRLYCSVGAEPHHVLDAGAVVPAPVEDHDLAAGREVLHVALHVHLALLAVRRRRQRHQPEDARADALGDRLDRSALAGARHAPRRPRSRAGPWP